MIACFSLRLCASFMSPRGYTGAYSLSPAWCTLGISFLVQQLLARVSYRLYESCAQFSSLHLTTRTIRQLSCKGYFIVCWFVSCSCALPHTIWAPTFLVIYKIQHLTISRVFRVWRQSVTVRSLPDFHSFWCVFAFSSCYRIAFSFGKKSRKHQARRIPFRMLFTS